MNGNDVISILRIRIQCGSMHKDIVMLFTFRSPSDADFLCRYFDSFPMFQSAFCNFRRLGYDIEHFFR